MTTMLADGNGRYTLWREGFLPGGRHPTNVDDTRWLPADLNGDGRDDLVHIGTSKLSTMLADGDGRYALWREGFLPRAGYKPGVGDWWWDFP